jgi:hypothetical protein
MAVLGMVMVVVGVIVRALDNETGAGEAATERFLSF